MMILILKIVLSVHERKKNERRNLRELLKCSDTCAIWVKGENLFKTQTSQCFNVLSLIFNASELSQP